MPPIIDAHFHIFAPDEAMPGHAGFVPPPFGVEEYRARARALGILGGVNVAGSVQGGDPRPLLEAAAALGPGFTVVAQADAAQEEEAMRALAAAGVRGLRYSLWRGQWSDAQAVAAHAVRAAACGLHAQVYADAAALAPAVDALARLPALVIDHLGMTEAGLPVVLDLARAGTKVKASGFGRVALNVPRALERIAAVAPAALMFGTDLPSVRAARPFAPTDIDLLRSVLGETLARAALHDTARAFYRL
ncbi:amidohydrolase family protein [Roseicella aerolata]|uniref:Amidohydrolase family protein n=1 Tax=Roseicella aerolata TaxID=2883479 RepID=A0A9X1LCC6_9PROT|nr:amidohydrolase family protein [Roseicella aerolata]MCB4824065.1 amidohydrolase family protein [Roseicella aerolata]